MEIIIIHVSVLIKIRTILLESLSLVLLVSHKVENTTTMVLNTFRSTGVNFRPVPTHEAQSLSQTSH